jgi:hypothetical protein
MKYGCNNRTSISPNSHFKACKISKLFNIFIMSYQKFFTITALIFAFALILFAATACDPKTDLNKGTLELNFQPRVGGQSYQAGLSYQDNQGNYYVLDKCRFFLTNVILVKKDGTEVNVSAGDIFNIDATARIAHGDGIFASYQVAPAEYKGVKFTVGVGKSDNYQPTSAFSNAALADASMFLSEKVGRKFIWLKGKLDTDPTTATLWTDYEYNIGADDKTTDAFLREVRMDTLAEHAFTVAGNAETQFIIEFDINEMLKDIFTINSPKTTISAPYSNDSTGKAIATKILDNLQQRALYHLQ